jgi:DNA-binding LacI/PurR family transcriptional regulator
MKNVGVVLAKESPLVGYEPLITELLAGLAEVTVQARMRVLTLVVPDGDHELDAYRRWHTSAAVDAAVILGASAGDTRFDVLKSLGIPFVAVVDDVRPRDVSSVVINNSAMMSGVVGYLAAHGHSNIAFVSGSERIESNYRRARAFSAQALQHGVEGAIFQHQQHESASAAVLRAIAQRDRPTALILGDDLAAVDALEVLTAAGLEVPVDVSIVAWNDATRCQLARPPITALSNEARATGVLVGECLLELASGAPKASREGPIAFIVERATVASPSSIRTAVTDVIAEADLR